MAPELRSRRHPQDLYAPADLEFASMACDAAADELQQHVAMAGLIMMEQPAQLADMQVLRAIALRCREKAVRMRGA